MHWIPPHRYATAGMTNESGALRPNIRDLAVTYFPASQSAETMRSK